MSQPIAHGGGQPAPGAAPRELRVARFRTHARRLIWPVLLLIAVAGAVGFLYGNLPERFADWMLVAAAAIVVLFLVFLPFLAWWAHTYTITTLRVIESRGILAVRRRELTHVRGYTIEVKRAPVQRMWGAGTLVLSNGVDEPMTLGNVPSVALVHEALVDQVEVNQILAHRDAQALIPPGPPSRP